MEIHLNSQEASLLNAFRRLPTDAAMELSGLIERLAALAPDRKIGTSNETTGPVRLSFDAAAMLVILPTHCLPAAIAALLRDTPPPPARGK